MITYPHVVRHAAQRIAGAIDRSVGALREGRVEQEPALTDRMLGAIEESLVNFETKGIRWSAKTLTDRGRGSQESKYGADFMGVLNIAIPGFAVSKGFLAQAKLIKTGSTVDVPKLQEQCAKMLHLSSASFVFLYGENGVRVIPAISVRGAKVDLLQLYSRSAQRFFEEHFQCFVGDPAIHTASPHALEALCEQYNARTAILLQAEAE